jgi:biopolymer transport protein ExbD
MQRIRSYVAVLCLLAMLSVTASAMAAPRTTDSPTVQSAQTAVQKQKVKLKGWIAKILDDLENKMSIPPP